MSSKRRNTGERILRVADENTMSTQYVQRGAEHSGEAGARVALVSGGNRGLGLELVSALARAGFRVVLAARSLERGLAAVDELEPAAAERVAVRQLDVTDRASVARLAAWLERNLGRCDVLVNNAAVLLDEDEEAARVDMDVVQRTLDTNLLGAWRMAQAVLPLMRSRRYGRIVNVSSGLALLATMSRGLPAYRVSKAAINALTLVLAHEVADDGVLVNACCPATARTDDRDHPLRITVSPDTPVWLATLPAGGPTGGFFRNRRALEW